ncbi:MAG: hypothetical protein K2I96_14235 [Lachnospiraceae bacterium]|nr:hypothetical protein [Lachnospiraceae bacterium]
MTTNKDREQIIEEAKSLFSEDVLKELKEWYLYTLQGNWQYVMFAVRRSYMMALVMETITGEEMQSQSGEFLTDAALFLRCGEMAAEYRKYGCFPRILFCDDIMIHGRNINHIIEEIREELVRILGESEKEAVEAALISAIEIHVYVRAWDSLLLLGPYAWKLHYVRKEGPGFWHQLASDMSSLVLRSNLTNASYVFTEYLSSAQMSTICNWLKKDGFVDTIFQNTEQRARFFFLNASGGKTKLVLSLRIVKNRYRDDYRVVPFVFLPSLDADETDALFRRILEKIPSRYTQLLRTWRHVRGMRSFNEMLTMLLSDAVLKSFNHAYGITPDPEDMEKELVKLTRNYNQTGFRQTRQMLKDLVGGSQSILEMEEVADIVDEVVSNDRIVIKFVGDGEKKHVGKREIEKRVEDFFYDFGYKEEVSAFELMELPYFQTSLRSKRSGEDSAVILKALNSGLTKEQSKYCLAYFLQMADAGISGLTSYIPDNWGGEGYAQFAKPGELSLLIRPLRLYEYIPMLSRMQMECELRLRALTDELKDFGAWVGWTDEQIRELVDFVDTLSRMGHAPRDWNGNYIEKYDKDGRNIYEVISIRKSLRHAYIEYAQEKYK